MLIPDPDFFPIPHPGSRSQAAQKKHQIPDPDLQHCLGVIKSYSLPRFMSLVFKEIKYNLGNGCSIKRPV